MPAHDDDRIRKPIQKDAASAARMMRLRQRADFPTVAAFARSLEVSFTRWANVEYGFPVSRDLAARLIERMPGLTYEWIWHGDDTLLPPHLKELLAADPPLEC